MRLEGGPWYETDRWVDGYETGGGMRRTGGSRGMRLEGGPWYETDRWVEGYETDRYETDQGV